MPARTRLLFGGATLVFPICSSAEFAGASETAIGVDDALKTMLGLALVVALIVVLAWMARRLTGARAGAVSGMRVVGALPIGARERVVLVDLGETQLVLGVAPGSVKTLHVRQTPASDTDAALPESGFRGTLERVLATRAQR